MKMNAKPKVSKETLIQDLIYEAADLKETIKDSENRIEEIKKQLEVMGVDTVGNHIGKFSSVLKISSRDILSDPDPRELLDYMKSVRKGQLYFGCIKVIKKNTITEIGEEAYKKMQNRIGSSKVWSFSK